MEKPPRGGENTTEGGSHAHRKRKRRRSRRPGRRDGVSGRAHADSAQEQDQPAKRQQRVHKHRRPDKSKAREPSAVGNADGSEQRESDRKHGSRSQQRQLRDGKLGGYADGQARHGKGNHRQRWRHRHSRTKIYAALDLGTNNCRLLVAKPQAGGGFAILDAFSKIVRLGEGLEASGALNPQAMERAIDALSVCATKLHKWKGARARLIATEACRRASNGEMFIQQVKARTGLDLEVVDRKTEARLAADGCGGLVDHKADGAVLFDIGGGSSELALLDCRSKKRGKVSDKIVSWTSLPIGVVTLSERFGGVDVNRDTFERMVSEVSEHLDAFEGRGELDSFWPQGNVHLLGTSGTVTTLAGLHLNLERYDRRKVDGIWLGNDDVDTVIERLLAMALEERAANPCIGCDRADLVLAGCAILQAIRRVWPAPRLRVADRGLREGLLTQMMMQDNAWKSASKYGGQKWRRSPHHGRPSKRQKNRHSNLPSQNRDTH